MNSELLKLSYQKEHRPKIEEVIPSANRYMPMCKMIFDKNQTEFSNNRQRAIWLHGVQIVPLETSLADIEDEEIREGCAQIYNCVTEIYADMYHNAEDYPQRPDWYVGFYLLWIAEGKAVQKCFRETFDKFLEKIPQFGFVFDKDTNSWINERYPLFYEYYPRFAELYKTRKKNMGDYLQHLDFRLFAERFTVTFNDLLRPLPNKAMESFMELREYAISKGMKEKKEGTGYFRYTYKSKIILSLRNLPIRISVQFRKFEQFLEVVENQPDADELVNYIIRNIKVCDGCAANAASRAKEKEKKKCSYYWVNIREARRLLCIANCINGTADDVHLLKRMIDVNI